MGGVAQPGGGVPPYGGRADILAAAAAHAQLPLVAADPVAAYHAAVQSMQSAAALQSGLQSAMPGHQGGVGFLGGGYPQLGSLMGI
jgi:hypothetical protein